MKYQDIFGQELEDLIRVAAVDKSLLHELLSDLLSPTEYQELAVRWQIVKQLEAGIPQREIAKNLKVSVATVTRGSREMMNKKGGFKILLNKLHKKPSA